jgi:hypothetical protein
MSRSADESDEADVDVKPERFRFDRSQRFSSVGYIPVDPLGSLNAR